MRKLILQMQITVDGYVCGPNGELDWMTGQWDEKLLSFAQNLTESFDTILLGRKMTDDFVSHWTRVMEDTQNPEYAAAKIFIETPKIVFTKTLDKSLWANTTLAKGDLVQEVNRLKNHSGRNIIVYGGAGFVSSLIKEGLIDEFNLFVNPVMISKGLRIFDKLEHRQKLKLESATNYECGVAVLVYSLLRD